MLSRRKFLTTAAFSAIAAPRLLAGIKAPTLHANAATWTDGLKPKTIAIIGDLQRTSTAESVFMARPQNDHERELILNTVADEKPDMLLFLGDQVSTGDDDDDWGYYDRIISRVNDAKIPIRSIYGNHDYGMDKNHAIKNFSARFPHQPESGTGIAKLGTIALVMVDTNFDQLSSHDVQRQADNYKKWLKELDADPEINGIVVAAHHPPYSNSELGANDDVITMLADPFYASKKAKLFLSGHVHSYERFVSGDKMFVISGGGGGPRRSVDFSSNRPFQNDAYRSSATLRPFHYMRMHVNGDSLAVETMMLRGNSFYMGDKFSVKLDPIAAPVAAATEAKS